MKNPFSILLVVIRLILLIIPMILFILVYWFLSSFLFKNTPRRAFILRSIYIKYCIFILGIRMKIEGEVHDKPALYVSNHRSLSDPVINLYPLHAYVIAKSEVANIPVLNVGAKLTGILYVERSNKDSRSTVRQLMIDTLLSGYNVLVYPEGTVTAEKEISKYKSGTFNEAVKHNIPVVPMAIDYYTKKDIWHNRSTAQHFFLQFGKLFTKARLVIGPAMTDTDGEALRLKVLDWTNEKIENIHSNWDSYYSAHTTAAV